MRMIDKDELKNDYACLETVLDLLIPYDDDPYQERCVVEMRIDDVQRAIIKAMNDIEAFMM